MGSVAADGRCVEVGIGNGRDRDDDGPMARDIGVDDVIHGKPEWGTLLRRGLTKKCPRCGAGHVYDGWFRMKERCPGCGLLFEREPGFFVGAYFINFAIAEGLLFVLVMGFVFWKDQHPEAGVAGPVVVAIVLGIGAPVLFYPFSRTIWSAVDIGMTPLELTEIVAAADAVSPLDEGGDEGGDRTEGAADAAAGSGPGSGADRALPPDPDRPDGPGPDPR